MIDALPWLRAVRVFDAGVSEQGRWEPCYSQQESELSMTADERDIQGKMIDLEDAPLTEVLGLDGRDTVLANSLRRIVDTAGRQACDTVAAFQNAI